MAVKTITSVQNPRVKDAIRLRNARHRAKQRRFLIDGARELLQAVAGGVRLVELFLCVPFCKSVEAREVFGRATDLNANVWHVEEEVFRKMAFGQRHDGVLAVAETPKRRLADFKPAGRGLIAVLEGIEKPGNVGAVLRSADGAGVAGVILAEPRTDIFNPNCIRASLGTVFTLPVCTATTDEALAWLRHQGLRIFAARPEAQQSYTEMAFGDGAAVVLGSEALGLSAVWQSEDIAPFKLPMHGAADSLNVSAASAIVFYEALRRRESEAQR
jgi:RNA methyltransferase, TrmH family